MKALTDETTLMSWDPYAQRLRQMTADFWERAIHWRIAGQYRSPTIMTAIVIDGNKRIDQRAVRTEMARTIRPYSRKTCNSGTSKEGNVADLTLAAFPTKLCSLPRGVACVVVASSLT